MSTPSSRRSSATAPSCVLALGTSTDWCSVALHVRTDQREDVSFASERAGQAQSRMLLPMAQALMRDAGVSMRDLDAVAFDAGPGAFTGLRIGCGVAQGLGFALGIPLVPVGSLETLAVQAGKASVFAAIDARMSEVYCAHFRQDDAGAPCRLGQLRLCPADAATVLAQCMSTAPSASSEQNVAIGDIFARQPSIAEAFADAGITVIDAAFPSAQALVRIAVARLAAGQAVLARDAAPVYVRDKVALDVDEQRRLREARAEASRRAAS